MSAMPLAYLEHLSRNESVPQGTESRRMVLAIHDAEEDILRRTAGWLQATFPRPGTPEWGQMNQQRAALIRKEIQGELTWHEACLLDILQRRTDVELDRAFPRGGDEDAEPVEQGR
jgi:hypothetical protein